MNNNTSDEKSFKEKPWLIVAGFFLLGVILIWSFWYPGISHFFFRNEIVDDAIFDSFDALNTLFSGLAFVGVIFAIILQKAELEEQRLELKKTNAAFFEQNETLKIQKFENTFFNLLSQHNQMVSDFEADRSGEGGAPVRKGKASFTFIFYLIRRDVRTSLFSIAHKHGNDFSKLTIQNVYDCYHESYMKRFKQYRNHLPGYFRSLYRIILYIDQYFQEEEINKKLFYSKIVRSQFSDAETCLIFLNLLFYKKSTNFYNLAKKFVLIDNIDNNYSISFGFLMQFLEAAFFNDSYPNQEIIDIATIKSLAEELS